MTYGGGPYVTIGTIEAYIKDPSQVLLQINGGCSDFPYTTTVPVECYLWDGSSWIDAGEMNFDNNPLGTTWQSLDVTLILNTIIKVNSARLKLELNTGGVSHSWIMFVARLIVDGETLYCNGFANDEVDAGVTLWGNPPYLQNTWTDNVFHTPADTTSRTFSYVTFQSLLPNSRTIGPLNLPYARVNDTIQTIIEEMITTAFVPWEWWFTYAGALMVAETRGSDKSAMVVFEAGIHIGSSTKESSSKQTAQRVRTVGRGESAEQDQNTSDWYASLVGMTNIGTFYERLVSEKELSEKDKADIWSQVVLAQDAPLREEVTVVLENDPYTASDFDVGDTVMVTDPDVVLSGKYRVKTIDKTVTGGENGGETTVVTLSNVRTDITDRLANYFKMLERMQHSSTYIDMMYAEGSKQRLLNANSIEDVWEQTASNKWAVELPADEADDVYLDFCHYGIQAPVNYQCDKDVFEIYSSDVSSYGIVYLAEPLLKYSRNPRFTCEFEVDTTSGDGTAWETNDLVYFRMFKRAALCDGADPDNPNKYCCVPFGVWGFGFEVIRTASNYELKAICNDGVNSRTIKVANITPDVKYIVEARMEWIERAVKFYFGKAEVDASDLEWGFRLRAILPTDINAVDCDELCPFHVVLQAGGSTSKQAFFIYRWKTQAIRAVEG